MATTKALLGWMKDAKKLIPRESGQNISDIQDLLLRLAEKVEDGTITNTERSTFRSLLNNSGNIAALSRDKGHLQDMWSDLDRVYITSDKDDYIKKMVLRYLMATLPTPHRNAIVNALERKGLRFYDSPFSSTRGWKLAEDDDSIIFLFSRRDPYASVHLNILPRKRIGIHKMRLILDIINSLPRGTVLAPEFLAKLMHLVFRDLNHNANVPGSLKQGLFWDYVVNGIAPNVNIDNSGSLSSLVTKMLADGLFPGIRGNVLPSITMRLGSMNPVGLVDKSLAMGNNPKAYFAPGGYGRAYWNYVKDFMDPIEGLKFDMDPHLVEKWNLRVADLGMNIPIDEDTHTIPLNILTIYKKGGKSLINRKNYGTCKFKRSRSSNI